jgi:glycosyltransferase involved in cell wall biosynthesis
VRLAAAILTHGATIVHINTSLNARAYWRDVVHMLVAKALLREQPDSAGALRLVFVGRLAIVTRVGAIPDVVFEGVHGLFVPLRSPGAIARAIARLDADRALLAQMGAACRKRIAASYSVERLTGDVRRLYADLFSGAAR